MLLPGRPRGLTRRDRPGMNEAAQRLQREAERIAAKHAMPEFYTRFRAALSLSRRLFFTSPLTVRLRTTVEPCLHDDLGHGLFHSARVSVETATLIFIELEPSHLNPKHMKRLMLLGQVAGLLHDICRAEPNHAELGSVEAVRILKCFPLSEREVLCVGSAIRNHEAFLVPVPCRPQWSQLISDCLYDADKFRWGPDTFTHTLWHMMSHQGLTVHQLIERFPWGMTGIFRIADTFRTATGRQYGPDIIQTGVEIGKEIYRFLLQQYKEGSNGQ